MLSAATRAKVRRAVPLWGLPANDDEMKLQDQPALSRDAATITGQKFLFLSLEFSPLPACTRDWPESNYRIHGFIKVSTILILLLNIVALLHYFWHVSILPLDAKRKVSVI